MDRRTLLKHAGLAVLGLGASACATRGALRSGYARLVAPVLASWDRVIRTTVGLRPHRPSGFVVRAERLDDKLLVHDYGHGGSGMSLSWGTGRLAAELALQGEARSAAVIGCGVAGLTATRQLQRRGFDVTIYARDVPPNTTSNMSLAAWTPTSGLVSRSRRTPDWDAQFRKAARIAYGELQLLAGRGYGVSWIDDYRFRRSPPSGGDPEPDPDALLPPDLRTGSTLLGPGEHPFPVPYAVLGSTLRIEPSIYLDALVEDVREAGATIVIREFRSVDELNRLEEPVVVNCTGLGARALFGDDELVPLKGQLTVLRPQPEVDYATFGGVTREAGGFLHMQPRSDGIVLGGTSERGEWSLEPDPEARRRVVEAHIELFSRMRA